MASLLRLWVPRRSRLFRNDSVPGSFEREYRKLFEFRNSAYYLSYCFGNYCFFGCFLCETRVWQRTSFSKPSLPFGLLSDLRSFLLPWNPNTLLPYYSYHHPFQGPVYLGILSLLPWNCHFGVLPFQYRW